MVAFEAMLCGDMWDVVVMYESSVFSSVFAITEKSEMGLYDVPMFMSADLYGCQCVSSRVLRVHSHHL